MSSYLNTGSVFTPLEEHLSKIIAEESRSEEDNSALFKTLEKMNHRTEIMMIQFEKLKILKEQYLHCMRQQDQLPVTIQNPINTVNTEVPIQRIPYVPAKFNSLQSVSTSALSDGEIPTELLNMYKNKGVYEFPSHSMEHLRINAEHGRDLPHHHLEQYSLANNAERKDSFFCSQPITNVRQTQGYQMDRSMIYGSLDIPEKLVSGDTSQLGARTAIAMDNKAKIHALHDTINSMQMTFGSMVPQPVNYILNDGSTQSNDTVLPSVDPGKRTDFPNIEGKESQSFTAVCLSNLEPDCANHNEGSVNLQSTQSVKKNNEDRNIDFKNSEAYNSNFGSLKIEKPYLEEMASFNKSKEVSHEEKEIAKTVVNESLREDLNAIVTEESITTETVKCDSTRTEIQTPKKMTPVKTPRRESPIKFPRKESPIKTLQKESPVKTPQKESPVKTPQKESPVKTPRKELPIEIISPVKNLETNKPDTKEREHGKLPVEKKKSIEIIEAENSPVKQLDTLKKKNFGETSKKSSKSKDYLFPSPVITDEDSYGSSDNDKGIGFQFAASQAYQSLIGGTPLTQSNQHTQNIESDSDDVERACAIAMSKKDQNIKKAPETETKKQVVSAKKEVAPETQKLVKEKKSTVSTNLMKNKLSKASRKALGFDSESEEDKKMPLQKSTAQEDSDEFDFYDS